MSIYIHPLFQKYKSNLLKKQAFIKNMSNMIQTKNTLNSLTIEYIKLLELSLESSELDLKFLKHRKRFDKSMTPENFHRRKNTILQAIKASNKKLKEAQKKLTIC